MRISLSEIKWVFPIDPAYPWFDSFANNFYSPDVAFIVDIEDGKPNAYAFSSPHLSDLNNPIEIWGRATSLKGLLDGAFYLLKGKDFSPFQLHSLVNLNNGTTYRSFKDESEFITNPFREDSNNAIFNLEERGSIFSKFISSMVWLAKVDYKSRGLLQFLGFQGCTWIALYAVLDFMKTGGLTTKDIVALAGTTEAELRRFTHTANNFSAIGPLCRHGDLDQQPPSNPMSLSEAAEIILPSARKFLEKKVIDKILQLQ